MGWNLPPGCNSYDIPGNGPDDAAFEYFLDTYAEDLEGLAEAEIQQQFERWKEGQAAIDLSPPDEGA